jgi:uncharacterized protein with HEPN domain
MTKKNLDFIKDDLNNLESMSDSLDHVFILCKKIKLKNNLNDEDYIKFDSLTSRFSRLSDIIVQKVLKTIDIINLEDSGTIRDRLNRAEKNGLISDIDEFIEIRKLRNDITHEYIQEEMIEIYKQVMKYIPVLKKTVKRINKYCKEKYKI